MILLLLSLFVLSTKATNYCISPSNPPGCCEPLIIHLQKIESITYSTKPDPYVKMQLLDSSGDPITSYVSWDYKLDSTDPVWNSAQNFGICPPSKSSLKVELYEKVVWGSYFTSDTKITEALIPVESISYDHMSMFLLKINDVPVPIYLKRLEVPDPRKTVFLVRHGQSIWNLAHSKGDVLTMLMYSDHPLTDTGIRQAKKLKDGIIRATDLIKANYPEGSPLDPKNPARGNLTQNTRAFIESEVFISSPLTRAVQTSLVALQPLLKNKGLSLMASAREQRYDVDFASKGIVSGSEVKLRAIREMSKWLDAPDLLEISEVSIDHLEATGIWWSEQPDTKEEITARQDLFLNQLRYRPEKTIVVVGHSHFIRGLFRRFIDPNAEIDPQLVAQVKNNTIENGGVAAVSLDFLKNPTPFQNVELLFGTVTINKTKNREKLNNDTPDLASQEIEATELPLDESTERSIGSDSGNTDKSSYEKIKDSISGLWSNKQNNINPNEPAPAA